MFFLRIALVLCAVAMLIALMADIILFAYAARSGGVALFAKPLSWFVIIFAGWNIALVIGYLIASRFTLFHFMCPK